MKKLVSIILLMSILFTTAYADYDFRKDYVGPALWKTMPCSDFEIETFKAYYSPFNVYYDERNVYDLRWDTYYAHSEPLSERVTPVPTSTPVATATPVPTPLYLSIENSTNSVKIDKTPRYPYKYSLVDKDENVIISSDNYSYMKVYKEYIIATEKNENIVCLSADGKVISPADSKYIEVSSFNENGIAIAEMEENYVKKQVLVNSRLEQVSDVYQSLDSIGYPYYAAKNDTGKMGIINEQTDVIVSFEYDRIEEKSGMVWFEYSADDGYHFGHFYNDFKEKLDVKAQKFEYINEKFILITTSEGTKFIDYKGNSYTDFYKSVKEMPVTTHQLYSVQTSDGKVGVVDEYAKLIAPTEYKSVKIENNYMLFKDMSDTRTSIYDFDGNFIKEISGDISYTLLTKYYVNKVEGKYKILDNQFNVVTDSVFDDIESTRFQTTDSDVIYSVELDGRAFYVDKNFNEIDLFDESRVTGSTYVYERPYICIIDEKYALIDPFKNEYIISYNEGVKIQYNSTSDFYYLIDNDKTIIFDKDIMIIGELPFVVDSLSRSGGVYIHEKWDFNKTKNAYDFTGRDILGEGFSHLWKMIDGIYCGVSDGSIWAFKSDTINLAYNTNIRTYINGVEIPCYAVDGYPCVFAENLGGYLFDVAWNGEEKRLDLTRNPEYAEINPVEVPAKCEHNTIFTDIYKNDVTVTVNGNAVKSYNTNGKMLIRAKDLENSGVTVTYENKKTIFDVLKENIEVYVNDTAVTFDQQPIIVDGRTLVPVRAIFEALGATVEWDEGSETVTSVKDGITVALKIGDNIMYVNGEGKELDVPAQLVNDRTLVPVRAISEAFGCTVDWNDITYSVCIK